MEYKNKIKLESLVAIIGIVILSGAFYLYKTKYSTSNLRETQKTYDELKIDAEKKMLVGELKSFAGSVVKIEGNQITIKVLSSGIKNEGEEVVVETNKNTIVRKIAIGKIPDGAKSVRAEEVILKVENIKVGDEVFLDIDKNNKVVVVDILKSKVKLPPPEKNNFDGIIEGQGIPLID